MKKMIVLMVIVAVLALPLLAQAGELAFRGALSCRDRSTGIRSSIPVLSPTVIQAALTTPTRVHMSALVPRSRTPTAIPGPIATVPGTTPARSASRSPTATGSVVEVLRKLDPCGGMRSSLSDWYRCSRLDAPRLHPSPPPAPKGPRCHSEERETISRLLVPLLITSGIWTGPGDGCAVALGILSGNAINLAVGPNAKCKFSLGITEEALRVLPPDELRAGLAHEIGHVQLGHFTARKERRAAEKKTRDEMSEKSTTTGAAVTAIPIIGPLPCHRGRGDSDGDRLECAERVPGL